MKTKYTLVMLAMGMSAAAWAQEQDDMYFNSKDRLVVNKANEQAMAQRYQQADLQAVRSNPVNPSDSYSGRGVNPESGAQSKNGTTLVQNNPDYFLSSYQPKNINSALSSGNNTYTNNSSFGSPYGAYGYNPYGYGGMGMGYGGFGSPYGYSPYSMMSMGYGMGGYGYSGMSYGMGYGMGYPGMSYGMGYGMGSMFSPFGMGYGMGSMMYNPYGYGYGYPTTVIVTDGINQSYGRHSVRGSTTNNYVDNSRNSNPGVSTNGTSRSSQVGRSATNYYDQGWRNNSTNYPSRSYYDNNSGTGMNRGGNNAGWGNSRSSFDNFGGGSRSGFGGGGGGFSGGGGGGGGGGGHSRGRN